MEVLVQVQGELCQGVICQERAEEGDYARGEFTQAVYSTIIRFVIADFDVIVGCYGRPRPKSVSPSPKSTPCPPSFPRGQVSVVVSRRTRSFRKSGPN